jgi:hypothetical protein
MNLFRLKMRLIAPFVVTCCLVGIYSPVAQAQIYVSDTNIANFTGPITSYAQLSNFDSGDVPGPTFTPTGPGLAANAFRVYIGGTGAAITGLPAGNWILATFPSAVSTIVVFPNIDHFGSAYDGYQYSIAASNDGTHWTMLFDATNVNPCVNNCVVNGGGEPFTLGTSTGTRPLFVNNVLTPSTNNPNGIIGYEAFFDFGTAYQYYAFGTSTVAGPVNAEQELSAVGTGPAAITLPLKGNGVTNSFQFGTHLLYNVIYPADFSVAAGTTMTISPNVLAQSDCNSAIRLTFPSTDSTPGPTCTTFTDENNFSVIFDVACSLNGASSTSQQCPKTTGFDPFVAGAVHSSEDISNILTYTTNDATPAAPQMLTAPEGSNGNAWVAYGVGFLADPVSPDPTRGSGGSDYNSMVVAADFFSTPNSPSPFAIPPYQFVGYGSPVANQAPGVINTAKAGSSIPLKWQLFYPVASSLGFNGGPVKNLNFPPNGYLSLFAVPSCSAGNVTVTTNSIPVDTETSSGFINDGNGSYHINWKTPKSLAGSCFTITLNVGDGVQHNADVQFK